MGFDALQTGDYIEYCAYDTSHTRQGTVVARIDNVSGDENWEYELHVCKAQARQCRQSKRGRGHDFHTDKYRVLTLGDLADEEAWKGFGELEKELGETPRRRKKRAQNDPQGGGHGPLKREGKAEHLKKKKKRKKDPGQGRARSLPAKAENKKEWFGEQLTASPHDGSRTDSSSQSSSSSSDHGKKKKKKKKARAMGAKDRGPFGSGHRVDYGKSLEISSASSEEGQLFRDGPSSGNGTQLQEYALKRPGRLAARLLQRMQSLVGKEGGPISNMTYANKTRAVAMNFVLTVLAPRQMPLRTLCEMKTLAAALDQIAAGRSHSAADLLAQRLNALELSQTDSTWNEGLSMNEWRKKMKTVLDREPGMKPLRKVLMEAMLPLKSGLGAFAREYSNPEKLPSGGEPTPGSPGRGRNRDVLPIHPEMITVGLKGITEDNVHWVRAIMTALNYLYCAGWAAPVCVPMTKSLSLCQLRAIGRKADQAERFAKLKPKIGRDLDAGKVIKAWPKPGSAAVVDLQDCLPDDLKKVPVDRRGHLITNGAGAVAKTKVVGGRTEMTAVLAEKESYLVIDSEDLQSAFNLFRLPLSWAPLFSFAKKAGCDLNPGDTHTILYLDNFDEVRYLKEEIAEKEAGQPSENHRRFITACELLGLPRNLGKQLCGALTGTLQGGELLGKEKILRHSYEKSVELFELSMALLTQELMSDYSLRHWTGKAAFAAAFKRPIYSVLQEVYGVMDWAASGAQISLPIAAIDEILVFMAMLPLAETDLSSEISGTISRGNSDGHCGCSGFTQAVLLEMFEGSRGHVLQELVARPVVWGKVQRKRLPPSGPTPGRSAWTPTRPVATWSGQGRVIVKDDAQRDDTVAVRQANAMARRAIRGLLEAARRALYGEEWYWTSFPMCCHGRETEEWTTIVPDDPENNDPYPWDFCLVFMQGVYDELRDLILGTLMEHQLRGSTKGLQDSAAEAWAADQTVQFLETMDTHQESEHLKWLLRHAHHTGCDVRLTNRGHNDEQHINILELTAFLTELRRRARDPAEHGRRYFNVVDPLVCFYVLGKGRSSSKRLNRVCRRIASVALASGMIPMTMRTISKWNFSDGASRKFEPLPRTCAELDEEVAEHINQEGDSVSFAGWALSGLKRFHPRCRGQLATSQLYLRNWQRVHLPKRTTPLSWLGAKAMASAAAQVGRIDLAVIVLLGFAFFLRTMELLSLAATHVRLFPDQGTVIIAIVNSKTARPQKASNSRCPCGNRSWFKFWLFCGTGHARDSSTAKPR
ncbi:unnamed protein product [Symbiodinium sp. CCMP2592]|nr:unnamed protein product [Symbiodinium sp. CCMP2592]